jgi:hypothetical protein
MTLRNSLIAKIWSALERSPFTIADFNVEFGDGRSNGYLVQITFRHQPAFSFIGKENYKTEVFTTEAPGEYKKIEQMALASLSDIPERITVWTRNLRDELRVTIPVYSELDDLRDLIERHVRETVDKPDVPFSNEEADELRSKLDDLANRFREMQEKSEITEQELNRLNQELVSIKANLTAYPKGIWYKTATNKIWAVVSKIGTSQESRQVIAKAAQKMLGLDL